MKLLTHLIIIFSIITISCSKEEKNNEIIINYKAQTRGFIYSILLEKNILEIKTNKSVSKKILTKNQQIEIYNLLKEIDFAKIESNISIEDLSVDKAIKGKLITTFNKNQYEYEFNHNKLPQSIQELFIKLENYTN